MDIVGLCPNEKESTTPHESCCIVGAQSNIEAPSLSSPSSNGEISKEQKLRLNNSFDETPKEGDFDSYSMGGSDKLMEAPYRNKCTRQSSLHAVRRSLSFERGNDGTRNSESSAASEEEQSLFELLFAAILDSIVSQDNEEVLTKLAAQFSDSDANGTPEFAPRLNWVAETCPGAPLKVTNRRRHIDKDICRKLEF